MSNKDYKQVVTTDQQKCVEDVTHALVEAFKECGLNVYETDGNKFKAQMRELGVQVDKVLNGNESGYLVRRGEILVKFIPASLVDGVVI